MPKILNLSPRIGRCVSRIRWFQIIAGGFVLAGAFSGSPLGAQSARPLDTIQLKSGLEIRGHYLRESNESGKTYILFRTMDGATWKLEKKRVIKRVTPADDLDREYLDKLKQLADTPDGHWAIYHWLGRQPSGKTRFREERRYHLRRITELDPSDARAFNLLGFRNIDGDWVPEDLLFSHHGYVRVGSKWVSRLHVESTRRREQSRQTKGELAVALQRWRRHVLGREPSRVAQQKLFELANPLSLSKIDEMANKESDPQVRKLFIEAIGTVSTPHARNLLVKYALLDPSEAVRQRAAILLEQDAYSPYDTTTVAAAYLAHPDNRIVRRTAELIGHLKADNAPFYLKDVLVTSHVVTTGNQPGRTAATFSPDGNLNSFGMGGGPTHKKVEVTNENVLAILRELTGEDFGYDEALWKRWYVQNYTVEEEDLRRDD